MLYAVVYIWYGNMNAGHPFWIERKICEGSDVMIPICIHTAFLSLKIPTNTVVRYYTYLGIHILFGKVMSRILWAVVLLSSKLSLTEIYIAVWLINEIFNVNVLWVVNIKIFVCEMFCPHYSFIAVQSFQSFNYKRHFWINYNLN